MERTPSKPLPKSSAWPGEVVRLRGVATTVLPELDVQKVKQWCESRVPARVRDQVRLEVTIRRKTVTILERRPTGKGRPLNGRRCVAPRSDTRVMVTWTLYFGDRYDKWTLYFDLDSHQPIDVIINELEQDPTCLFWG